MNQQPYEILSYFALALDPIHVGTGGYRLGRVDMTIVREPGTNLPKIPGTSLSGACRTYVAMVMNRYRWQDGGKTYICAGQGQADEKKNTEGHCGEPDCPVCVTFGFSKGEKSSFQGLAQFSDARLVFFPVHSLAGPVWVTCPAALADWGVTESEPSDDKVRVAAALKDNRNLNLGWLMLTVNEAIPLKLEAEKFRKDLGSALSAKAVVEIIDRAVLVSSKLFSQIVNDNLEVRTSVSIDPATGAAAEGALFTYEALPRGSVLAFEVVVSNPKFYCIDGKIPLSEETSNKKNTAKQSEEQERNDKQPDGKQKVKETVESGLNLFEALGVGGMNTRGMGRLRVWGLNGGGGK